MTMGQAKRRGSFEQRQTLAIEAKKKRQAEKAAADVVRRNAMTAEERKKEAIAKTTLSALEMLISTSLPNRRFKQ